MTPLKLLTLRWYSTVVYWLVISDLVFYLISEYFVQYVQHVLYLFHLSDYILLFTVFTDRLQQVKDNKRGCTWQLRKRLKLFTYLVNKCLIEETAALGVSTERLKTMGCGSRCQSDITRGKNDTCLCWVLLGGIKKTRNACVVIVSRVA
jgi:hypothetical protein